MNREQIYESLLQLVSTYGTFKTVSRNVRSIDNVSPAEMPALFMAEGDETISSDSKMTSIWTLRPDIIIYVSTGNDVKANANSLLNPIIDNICQAFDSDNINGRVQTLNGLVLSAKLDGGVVKDGGFSSTKALAIIPINILTTN